MPHSLVLDINTLRVVRKHATPIATVSLPVSVVFETMTSTFLKALAFTSCRARRALSKLVSATDNDLAKLDGGQEEEKDLQKEEKAVIQAATTSMSETQVVGYM